MNKRENVKERDICAELKTKKKKKMPEQHLKKGVE